MAHVPRGAGTVAAAGKSHKQPPQRDLWLGNCSFQSLSHMVSPAHLLCRRPRQSSHSSPSEGLLLLEPLPLPLPLRRRMPCGRPCGLPLPWRALPTLWREPVLAPPGDRGRPLGMCPVSLHK